MNNNELQQLAELISASISLNSKAVLSADEAARYCCISLSHLYKLTSARKIAHSKPQGKLVYFRREDLDAWLLSNRVATMGELDIKARTCVPNYNKKQKGGGRV